MATADTQELTVGQVMRQWRDMEARFSVATQPLMQGIKRMKPLLARAGGGERTIEGGEDLRQVYTRGCIQFAEKMTPVLDEYEAFVSGTMVQLKRQVKASPPLDRDTRRGWSRWLRRRIDGANEGSMWVNHTFTVVSGTSFDEHNGEPTREAARGASKLLERITAINERMAQGAREALDIIERNR